MSRSYDFRPAAEPSNHQIYSAYMNKLSLKSHHSSDLKKRGLNVEQISRAGYVSKGKNNVKDTYAALGHVDNNFDLKGVAGFYFDTEKGHRNQSGYSGLMIPCRDYWGNISSLLIRNDQPKLREDGKPRNKYVAFSSNGKREGGKVHQSTHCPVVRGAGEKVCGGEARLTEGLLKADVATALDPNMYCFGMHGLNLPKDLGRVIVEAEVYDLVLAVDAGEDDNDDMLRLKGAFLIFCEEQGIDAHIEIWDPKYGKGIDDVLAAGHGDKIRRATEEEIAEIRANVKMVRPEIEVFGGGLSIEATLGEQALIAANLPIYQWSSYLVTPVLQKVEASKGRQVKIAVLHRISKARLTDHLCKVASWVKQDAEGCLRPINPPYHIADTIMNRFGCWSFSHLSGVIMTPTLRTDGSLLDKVGYDPSTRLFLLDVPEMPEIPDEPTKEDALEALQLLEGLLIDFPFVDEVSRSVALSALITPIVRGACGVVPMHAINAPTPGTGKSYFLDTVSAIALGQPCPVMAAGRTEEETEKRLGAALLGGQPVISIDNVNGDLGGDALCQFIERPIVNVRILGKSEQVKIESRTSMFANGNNLRLTGDMTRRAVLCLMDANIERPETRVFKLDPVQTVLNDRGKYIAAILTIIRAYIVAGKPNAIEPRLASFEEWSDLVRSSLVWLGHVDPLKSMDTARAEDPVLQSISEMYAALWDVTQGRPYTAKQLVEFALGQDSGFEIINDNKLPALKDALQNVAADRGGRITPQRLGHWLRRHKGRIFNNMRLENEVDNHGHPAKWWLTKSG